MSKDDEINFTIKLLEDLAQDTNKLAELPRDQYVALMKAAGLLSRPHKWESIKRHKANFRVKQQKLVLKDREARAKTGIREARQASVYQAPAQIETHTGDAAFKTLTKSRNCYVCKAPFTDLHTFYDAMCRTCGDFNYQKRFQTASLKGQVAVITGSRLKIGYQASLMMLRAGAHVVATTRFPVDSAMRFAREADFNEWSHRLQVHGLDLRHIPSVEIFARYMETTLPRLDILINNAAQTVRRPPGFYKHLMANEMISYDKLSADVQKILAPHRDCQKWLESHGTTLPQALETGMPQAWHSGHPAMGIQASAKLSQIPYTIDQTLSAEEIFPRGKLDADLQQVDLRTVNSWRLKLADVPSAEMLEVQLVNSVAPFVLCSKLVPLMRRDNTGKKHIVNVSAMEGKFNRFTKTDKHPHTNMAKAALNMLTHTSAKDLAEDGIYMNAVDTGWVTDEDPAHLSAMKQAEHDFQPPLDIVDGAARVCDPFFDGINTGLHWCGKFLKDYKPTEW